MKYILTEMKNNLQGINNRVDEPRTKSEIWIIRKQKTPNQSSIEKKNPEKMRRV